MRTFDFSETLKLLKNKTFKRYSIEIILDSIY